MSDDPDFEMEVVSEGKTGPVDSGSSSQSEDDLTDGTAGVDGAASKSEIFGLGPIPEDWEVESLPHIAEVEMGSSPPSSTYNEDEKGLPFYQGNADFGYLSPEVSTWCSDPVKTADEDDILISIRAPVGDLNIADEHCCIGRGLAALRPNGTNGLYLFYALAKMSRWLSRLASGSTFESVSSADLEKVDLAIPPLPEQRKIASVLSTVDQAIQKTEAIIEQTKRVKRGLMRDLFSKGYYEHNSFQSVRIGPKEKEFPDGWKVKSLGSVLERLTNGISEDQNTKGRGFPVTRIETISDGRIDYSKVGYVDQDPSKFAEYKLKEGDVLFSHINSLDHLGKNALYEGERDIYQGMNLILMRANKKLLNRRFFYHYLNLKSSFDFWKSNCGKAVNQVSINQTQISRLKIPIPTKDEQNRIVERIEEVDEGIKGGSKEVKVLRSLKKGLMQDLLTGEVRTADKAIEVLDEVEAHG